jgi:maltose alpha-D-glucosyltransferase/alpha-amylase
VQYEADAWRYTMDSLSRFFERTQTHRDLDDDRALAAGDKHPLALSKLEVPAMVNELVGTYLERARLLGQRTAELHLALAGHDSDPDFSPEPISDFYKQGLYHGILALTTRTFQRLRVGFESLTEDAQREVHRALSLEEGIRRRLRLFRDSKMTGSRIRQHGNYHLGEILYTGKDFVIIDFEGEPNRHLTERRIKRPAFWDVASMLSSFHDAAHAARLGQVPGIIPRPDDSTSFRRWAEFWCRWVGATFLKGYLATMGPTPLLPQTEEELGTLLNVLCLEKVISQVDQYQRPDDLIVPLMGILRIIENWPLPADLEL